MRSRIYLQQGCSGFLAYVMDTQVEGMKVVVDVPIVREFPDVFPRDLPGLPPER